MKMKSFREDALGRFSVHLASHEMNVKGMFIQMVIHLLRENYWNEHLHLLTNMEELVVLRNFLNHNVNQKVTLDKLASISGISKFYLIQLFKKMFGMSPIQYHQLIRIEKAKEMIPFTTEPLNVIAENFGCPDIQSFSKAFKKTNGVSPSFYRKN